MLITRNIIINSRLIIIIVIKLIGWRNRSLDVFYPFQCRDLGLPAVDEDDPFGFQQGSIFLGHNIGRLSVKYTNIHELEENPCAHCCAYRLRSEYRIFFPQ